MSAVRPLLLAAAIAAALAAPATAGPTKTIRLAWNERATVGSRTIMTFNVRSLTVVGNRWTVEASFRNSSRSTLAIRKRFAVLYGPSDVSIPKMRVLPAASFRPALPARLRPGKSWNGRFSGAGGASLRDTYMRVRFGYFEGRVLPGAPGFSWITDHLARVR